MRAQRAAARRRAAHRPLRHSDCLSAEPRRRERRSPVSPRDESCRLWPSNTARRPPTDTRNTAGVREKKMNHLSLSELCCLFCCPPCPSKIASKLAFLPPDPTYTLMCDESGGRWTLHLSERADWQYSSREKDAIECFMTRTSRGNRIACMFVRCSPNAKFTLLFSHGNAVDLGQMSSFYIGLGSRINCNVFSYDYSGYGASSGKPSEKNLYADVDAAWQALRTRYGIRPENRAPYSHEVLEPS
ncbi:protein ABHD17B [Arapaima gigas]